MSAIYCWLNSDLSKEVTRTASKGLTFNVNVGSRDLSKRAVELKVLKTEKGFKVLVDGKVIKTINSDL